MPVGRIDPLRIVAQRMPLRLPSLPAEIDIRARPSPYSPTYFTKLFRMDPFPLPLQRVPKHIETV
jgi:hypothetical protein